MAWYERFMTGLEVTSNYADWSVLPPRINFVGLGWGASVNIKKGEDPHIFYLCRKSIIKYKYSQVPSPDVNL